MQNSIVECVVICAIAVINIAGMIVLAAVSKEKESLALILQVLTSMGASTAGLMAYLRSLRIDNKTTINGGIDPNLRQVIEKVVSEMEKK